MDKIQIANILLTRRCNLRCDYCSIVKDNEDKPIHYPSIKHYRDNEISVDQWKDRLLRLKANNPNVFLIFYGGEPFLYNELIELIKFCHEQNLYYTIISNNTEAVQPLILKLYSEVGSIRGFTASIDPGLALYLLGNAIDNENDDAIQKTIAGFDNLKKLKEIGVADDVVAEITVSNSNYHYLYDTLKILSDANIYSSITTLDLKKSRWYDFSNITDESLLVQKTPEIKELFEKIIADKSLLVHIPKVLLDLYDILPCEMRCNLKNDITNITIDADGSLRLCLRIRGVKTPDMRFADCISVDGKISPIFKKSIQDDYCDFCRGCNWTCMMFTEKYSDKDIVEHKGS